ncbi:MAG: hypothetical protein LBT40_00140 [Deltaproteobacteria bacterium]|jgi:hypothetical protein|nr:hypothetical protein [Deltaproteobacteria bacterium]
MDQFAYEWIIGHDSFTDFLKVRSEGFLCMEHAFGWPRPVVDMDSLQMLTFPASSSFPARRVQGPSDAGLQDVTGSEDEREVSAISRLAAMEHSSPAPPVDIGDRIAALLSAAAGRGDEAAVRRLLAAAGDLLVSEYWFSPASLMQTLDGLGDGPGHSQELVCALSCAAIWCLNISKGAKEADMYLGRAWSLSGFSEMEDPLLPFAALTSRMTLPLAPAYGPGAEAEEGGAIVNALAVACRLRDPVLATFLPFRLLSPSPVGWPEIVWPKMRKHGSMDLELPDSAAFRVVWEAARLALKFSHGEFGSGEAAYSALKSLEKSGDIRAFAAFEGPAAAALADAAKALGKMLGELDGKGTAMAVAFAVPFLASGQISFRAFNLLFNFARQANPAEFQGAVMRAVASGLFGTGSAMVLALTNAALISSKRGRRLSSFSRDAATIRNMAGSPDSPGPFAARIAAAFIECELAGRTSWDGQRPFAALARLCRSGADPDGGTEASPPEEVGLEKGKPGGGSRHLALYAYAAALVTASWGEDERASAVFGPGTFGDNGKIRELLLLLPEDAFRDKTFVESILPGACYVAMFPGGFALGGGDSGLMAGACAPGPDSPVPRLVQTVTPTAVSAWGLVADCREPHPDRLSRREPDPYSFSLREPDPDRFSQMQRELLPCLDGPLPLRLRTELVKAVLWGLAFRKLPDEMERFFLANSLMLVRDFPEGQDPGKDRLDGDLLEFSYGTASWPAPAEAVLCHRAPSGPNGSAVTEEGGAGESHGPGEGKGAGTFACKPADRDAGAGVRPGALADSAGVPGGAVVAGAVLPGGPEKPGADAEAFLRTARAILAYAETLFDDGDDEGGEDQPMSCGEFLRMWGKSVLVEEEYRPALAILRAQAGRGDEGYRGWLARYARELAAELGVTGAELLSGGNAYAGATGKAGGVSLSGAAGGPAGGTGARESGLLSGNGFRTVALGEENQFLFAAYVLCLAECGLYERALEYILLDTSPLDMNDIKKDALSMTATGLARSGNFKAAGVALKILHMVADYEDEPEASEAYEQAEASVRACEKS